MQLPDEEQKESEEKGKVEGGIAAEDKGDKGNQSIIQ
jgi:hypothetical protein